jgi:multidrug transporter EmrE-like cation transporter
MNPIWVIIGVVVLGVTGDYFLKMASGKERSLATVEFGVGAGLYMLSAVGFLIVMRHMSLASIGVWYALGTILLLAGLGIFVFKEELTGREMAGIALAFVSLGLLSRFS